MASRVQQLLEEFTALHKQLVDFVETCTDEDWTKITAEEQWPVGVVARHVAAGHFGAVERARQIVESGSLPQVTREEINQRTAQHALEYADCTREEVLDLLRAAGDIISTWLTGLQDVDLDRTAFSTLAGEPISAEQYFRNVVIGSSTAHLASMQATVASKA